jgi:multiple sugar transport system permease protein
VKDASSPGTKAVPPRPGREGARPKNRYPGPGASQGQGRPRRLPAPGKAFRIGALVVSAVVFLYPILGFLLAPTRTQGQLYSGAPIGFGHLGQIRFDWDQIMGFENGQFATWMANTAIVSIGGALLAIVLALPSGYALARLRFPGRRLLLLITLVMMVMPSTVLVIPLFLEVSAVHLLDSFWPVIVIFGFYPFGVYLAFIHFRTALPGEIVEAARIDGLREFSIFLRIGLPLSKQAVALVGFFAFVASWTNFFLPYILLPETAHSTVAVGLFQIISDSQLYTPSSVALNVKLYMPELVFAGILTMLPVLLVFLVAQRHLRRGVVAGAVRG